MQWIIVDENVDTTGSSDRNVRILITQIKTHDGHDETFANLALNSQEN
jgi:hypothetical protein